MDHVEKAISYVLVNKDKTLEEVTSKEDSISGDGWVNVHVAGVDAVKSVLAKLPQNEHVSWLGAQTVASPGPGDIKLQLPPDQIAGPIKEHAERCGLDFVVSTR